MNAFFKEGKRQIRAGEIDLFSDPIAVMITEKSVNPDYETMRTLSDIPADVLGMCKLLVGKSVHHGKSIIFDADDVLFEACKQDTPMVNLLFFKDEEDFEDAVLIACVEEATGLPTIVKKPNVSIEWDNGYCKIFNLQYEDAA